ncbi:MAG: GNAT family N-acetyltransferase [Micrococcales bacterium]|nr:GNAT family N-acetyltransferase [Micrococcales bacterium]
MIRTFRAGDEDGLFALVGQLGHYLPLERSAFDATVAAYLAGEHPSAIVYVAEDGDAQLVGYVLMTVVPLLSTNGPSAQLQEIVVSESARGADWGTRLVRAVEEECVARGVMQLTVAARRAGGFYDRLGYHESAEYMRRFFG